MNTPILDFLLFMCFSLLFLVPGSCVLHYLDVKSIGQVECLVNSCHISCNFEDKKLSSFLVGNNQGNNQHNNPPTETKIKMNKEN